MRPGFLLVAKAEFLSIITSVRMLIISILLFLVLISATYGTAYAMTEGIELGVIETIKDPDNMVMFLAGLLYYFGAIGIITLSFDTVTGERINRTLPLLLVRPIRRWEIALGKFLGILAAILVPTLTFTLLGLGVYASMSNQGLSLVGVTALIVYTILYYGVFISLEIALSSLTRRVGSSILAGMMLWLIFVAFWQMIPAGYAYTQGIIVSTKNDAYLDLIDWFGLGNPGVVYPTAVGLAMAIEGLAVPYPNWVPTAAMVTWFLATLLLAMETFRRTAID